MTAGRPARLATGRFYPADGHTGGARPCPHGRPASFLRVAPGFRLGAAAFLARFERVLTSPWRRFVLEVNPVGTRDAVVAVDGLLILDPGRTRRQSREGSVLTTIVPPLFVD